MKIICIIFLLIMPMLFNCGYIYNHNVRILYNQQNVNITKKSIRITVIPDIVKIGTDKMINKELLPQWSETIKKAFADSKMFESILINTNEILTVDSKNESDVKVHISIEPTEHLFWCISISTLYLIPYTNKTLITIKIIYNNRTYIDRHTYDGVIQFCFLFAFPFYYHSHGNEDNIRNAIIYDLTRNILTGIYNDINDKKND